MKQTEYILAINQHPSFPCQLVEKSLWPEEPNINDLPTNDDWLAFNRQKLSALQAGAVVGDSSILFNIQMSTRFEREVLTMPSDWKPKAGVYELDPSRWVVEVKWQAFHHYWTDNTEEDATIANKRGFKTRKLAIISPVETPKEPEGFCEKSVDGGMGCHCSSAAERIECGYFSVEQEGNKVEPTRKLAMDELREIGEIRIKQLYKEKPEGYEHYIAGILFMSFEAQSLRQKEIENIRDSFDYANSLEFKDDTKNIWEYYLTQTYKI